MNRKEVTSTPAMMPDKQLYRVPEAMRVLSLSRTVIYELIRSGRLRSVTQGRARLIPASAIAEYVALLETESKKQELYATQQHEHQDQLLGR